jgi:hypothetical protein
MPDRRVESVIQQTINFAVGENDVDDIVGLPIIPWLARAHALVPPWWSLARDAYLRDFWKRSSHLSLMMYTAQTLLANTPMRVEAKDTTIVSHVEQAEMFSELLWKASEFGETLFAAKARFAEDYLSQDNGGFMEVLGDGRADGPIVGPPLAVRHLDAQYCWRTRNPHFPVVYHDPNDGGKAYKLHATRVIPMSQMSSTEALMNGVGFSAVSRSLQFAQHLYDIYIYKQEKLGSRPISKLLVGSGFTGSHIMQAVKTANEVMSNANLSRYSKIVGIGSTDTAASLDTVDLNDFDPFDEQTSVTLAVYGLAAAFGIPIQEVWPASSGRSSRAGDMQESRQRGKLPAEFNAQLSLQLSRKYLPAHLRVVADWRDDYQDERRAVNQDIRARNRERDLGNESITIRGARQQMVEAGDITRDQFVAMEQGEGRLENGSTIAAIFYSESPPFSELLAFSGVPSPTAIRVNNKEEMLDKIDEQLAEVHERFAETPSHREIQKLNLCVDALTWLRGEYERFGVTMLPMEMAIAAGVPERGDPNLQVPPGPGRGHTGERTEGQAELAELAGQQAGEPASQQGRTPDESRPATVEGGSKELVQKQVNASNLLEFLIAMESELAEEFRKEGADRNRIKEIAIGWLLFAFLEGIDKSEDDLTAEERKDLADSQELFEDQLDTIMERHAKGAEMDPTIFRLTNQAANLFWTGFVKADDQGTELTWVIGLTKESCGDCQGANGQTKTKKEWAASGLLPQSSALACTGANCLCSLDPA